MRWKQFLKPVKGIDAKEADAYIEKHKEGTFTLLDVRQVSEYKKRLYGMIMPGDSTTETSRCVFVIDPEGKIRA